MGIESGQMTGEVAPSPLQDSGQNSYDTSECQEDRSSFLAGEMIEDDSFIESCSFEEDEDAYVWSSISHLSSTCGTYAVADPEGLLVIPRKPSDSQSATGYTKSNLSSLYETNANLKNGKDYAKPPLPYDLPYRSHVQVVHIEDGWAQLARNRGYLKVNSSQLVKVGAPEDKACEVEGMLLKLDHERKELSDKQARLSRIEPVLEKDLDKALLTPYTIKKCYVLDDDIRRNDDHSNGADNNSPQDANTKVAPHSPAIRDALMRTPSPTHVHNSIPFTQHLQLPNLSPPSSTTTPVHTHTGSRAISPPQISLSPSNFATNNGTVTHDPRTRRSSWSNNQHLSSTITSTPPHRTSCLTQPPSSTNTSTPPHRTSWPAQLPTSENATTPDSRNRRSSWAGTPSPRGLDIDYRTGFSGHYALSQSFAPHPRPSTRSAIRMMSQHKGLGGSTRNFRKNTPTNRIMCTSPENAISYVEE